MKYNTFIKDAPRISEIGLGAWQLGAGTDWLSMSEKEAIEMVHKALDLGINFFDTAPNYGNGTSELRLGKALKETYREKIVINTKFGHTDSGGINFNADYIRESMEGSLRRLQMDYVDSLILHNPPFSYLDGNYNSHYETLEKLKGEGKIKAYGASLDTYEEMQLFMNTTNGEVIEAFFNIFHQDSARAFNLAKQKGVRIIAKIPLDSGWLSGKYNAESTFDDIRKRWSKKDKETRAYLVQKVRTIIPEEYDLANAAISFCLAYDEVSTVIPGNKNMTQLVNNLKSIDKPLPESLVKKLESFYVEHVKPLHIPW